MLSLRGAIESASRQPKGESLQMETAYVVRTVPLVDPKGATIGWVRVGLFNDGTMPSGQVFLRDGSVCGQAEALERVSRDRELLYGSQEEAARDGLARLRAADAVRFPGRP
jgi:hypothetical protein